MGKPDIEAYYKQPELWQLERYEGSADQRLRARVVASLIDPQIESVLDVGCGNGFITRRLRAKRVVGLDASEEALTHFEGEAILGSVDRLPFDDRSFDAIVCVEVLEHLNDEMFAKAVRELNRVAKKFLVIGVPYREDLRENMTQCAKCGCRYHIDLHQRAFYGPKDILRLFPDFTQKALVLLGERTEISSRVFRWIRYALLGPGAQSAFARCPNCGAAETITYKQKSGKRFRRWFFDGLAWRMKKKKVPHWLIMLLERQSPNL